MRKGGYSRLGVFGTMNHYDNSGYKIGESTIQYLICTIFCFYLINILFPGYLTDIRLAISIQDVSCGLSGLM